MTIALRFSAFGGPEVLSLDDVGIAAPGKGEVRIRTRALGLNRVDVMYRTGNHFIKPTFPQPLGCEASGVVEAVGPGVVNISIGDEVSVVPSFLMTEYATHSRLALVPARAVVPKPSNLSWEEAASVWMAFGTAYAGLIDFANLRRGDNVLISAASSSVGLAAIQIANMVGAAPIAMTRSGTKRQRLLEAGAAAVVATDDEDVSTRLGEITKGRGVQVIFDPVAGPVLGQMMDAAASNAQVIVYGALSSEPTPLPILPLLGKRLTIRGCDMFEVTTDDARLSRMVEFITGGLRQGLLKPVIGKVFEFDQIGQAYQYMEENSHVGKVVVKLPGSET